jgi:hypothetical protein
MANVSDNRQADHWCFTYFPPEDSDPHDTSVYDESEFHVDYLIAGLETCPTTGKLHHQGYVKLSSRKRLRTVKKILPPSAHLTLCRGTAKENIDYCSKQDMVLIEYGERPADQEKNQGKRTDIDDVKRMVFEGKPLREILPLCSSYQAMQVAKTLTSVIEPKRNWQPKVTWIYGSSGTGKTRYVNKETKGKDVYHLNRDEHGVFWEKYDGQSILVIDDIRRDHIKFTSLLKIMGRDEYPVNVKFGSRQLLCKEIWITSIKHPLEEFHTQGEEMEQLMRRIHCLIWFESKGKFRKMKNEEVQDDEDDSNFFEELT